MLAWFVGLFLSVIASKLNMCARAFSKVYDVWVTIYMSYTMWLCVDRGMLQCIHQKASHKISLLSSGNRFWLFREANLEPGYPLELVDYGIDIPYDRIDTAIWWEPSGYTYFFQGDR